MVVIDKLIKLSSQEVLLFSKFMQSPFFEIPEGVQILYHILSPSLNQGTLSELNREDLYQTYKAKTKIDVSDAQFNKTTWALHQFIEKFYSHLEFKKNQELQEAVLLQYYSETASAKVYTALHKKTLKQIRSCRERSEDYYLKIFQLKNDQYFHHDTDKKDKRASLLLSEAQADLDRFYLLTKLRLAIELMSRQQFLKEQHTIPLLEEISALAKKQHDPVFKIYLQLAALTKGDQPLAALKKVKLIFEKHLELFPKKEQAIILQFLLNYSNRLFKKGKVNYLVQLFELNDLAVRHKLLLENNQHMSDTSFTNVIITACLYKDFDYAYHFLQTHKKYLNPQTRENAVNLSWAYIYFHSKQFDQAWKKIEVTKFATTDYKLRARSLQLRCFYEALKKGEDVQSLLKHGLENFKKFLYRLSSLSDQSKAPYYHLVTVITALFLFNSQINSKKDFKEQWIKFIEDHVVIAKKWLYEKIDKL